MGYMYFNIRLVIRKPSIGMSLQHLIFNLARKLDAITSVNLNAFLANNL